MIPNQTDIRRMILKEGKVGECIHGLLFPESSMRLQDGRKVSVFHCYEPRGSTMDRDRQFAAGTALAARLTAKELYKGPFLGVTDGMYGNSFTTAVNPNPIVMSRGGAAVAATLTGGNYSGSDAVTYGSAGITNAVPPVVTSTTVLTLSVQASGGTVAGLYDLFFNGSVWRKAVKVV